MKVFEVDGVIPCRSAAKTLELVMYGDAEPSWDSVMSGALERKYGEFSIKKLPNNRVFNNSREVVVLGGEKRNIRYDPFDLSASDFNSIQEYGNDSERQPYNVSQLAKGIVEENGMKAGDVVICPDHGLGIAVQMHVERPDTIVNFDWHSDFNGSDRFDRASWSYYAQIRPDIFGMERAPKVVHTASGLTKNEIKRIGSKVAVTVCMDVLKPEYADAVANLKDDGMDVSHLVEQMKSLNDKNVVSASFCERRRVLDDTGRTAATIREVIEKVFGYRDSP